MQHVVQSSECIVTVNKQEHNVTTIMQSKLFVNPINLIAQYLISILLSLRFHHSIPPFQSTVPVQ